MPGRGEVDLQQIPLSCEPFQCNTLPHNYLLLPPNYFLMQTIVTSTHIHMSLLSIPTRDMCHTLTSGPKPILYACVISTLSFLILCLCTLVLLFVHMHACTYARMALYMLDVLFSCVGRSPSTLAN